MHMHQRLSAVLMSFAVAGAAWAHPEYKVTVVGPAGSVPTGINAAGVVVGYYPVGPNVTHAFLNRGRGLVDLGTFRGTSSNAAAINDKGQVLGHWTTSGGQVRGYIHDAGRMRDIGVIGGSDTTWTDINNAGYVSGFTFADAFLRAPSGSLTRLGHLPGDDPAFPPRTEAYALNNRNQVTGVSGSGVPIDPLFHGFIWTRGRMTDLGLLSRAPVFGNAINDRGQIAGTAALGRIVLRVAFVYSRGRIMSIDNRPASTDPFSTGVGINNHGHVVGYSNHLGGYIWRGKRMQGLLNLVDPRQGWRILNPTAINDAGQIIALASRNGQSYSVRLDLIRPHTDAVPAAEPDEEASVAPPVTQ
jgi:probable HAF family extracellular repeat protein